MHCKAAVMMGVERVLRLRLRAYACEVYRAVLRLQKAASTSVQAGRPMRERAKAVLKAAVGEAVRWSSGLGVEAGFRAGVTRVQAAWLRAGLPWVGALEY
jgi:hypothetical protein